MLALESLRGCEHRNLDLGGCVQGCDLLCSVAEAGAVVGKRVGDAHYSTSALCPIYPAWEKSIAPWHNRWNAQREAGENPKMERRSTEFSPISLIMAHTVRGIIRARLP
jgi:hypothetical protein